MPTVPLNTITGPSGARLPNVGFAKPNMAEAQGSVAHALSSAASTAGRSADIMGQAIRSEAQRSDLLMRTEAAKASGRASMFAGIGNLGNTMIKGGAEFQRLSEIRAAREAQSLLSQFRMDMSRTMYGAQDAATGQRIPGTLETPFAPTTEGENEPQGATIATSKAMRAWHENPNGAFQKASPRVKELFRQYAAEPTEDFMRQSFKQDAENYQRWKSQQDQMSESASLNNLNLQAASGDQQVWNMAAQRDAGAWAMSQMESYQADPTNRDPAKAKWRGDPEQSDEMAKYFRTGFLQKANLQRIETLTASAMAEPDKARREQFLEMAAEAAEWKPDGAKDPILPPDVVAKMKLTVRESADKLVQRDIAVTKMKVKDAETAHAKWILTGDAKAKEEYDKLLPELPQHVAIELQQTRDNLNYKREMAMLEDAKADYVATIGTPQEAKAKLNMLTTASLLTSNRAKLHAPAFIEGTEREVNNASQNAMADYLEKVVYFGGEPGPDGSFRSYSDAKLTTMVANASIPFARARSLTDEIAKRQDRDPVIEQKVYETIDRLIGSDIDQAFKLQDGVFEYETRTEKGRTMPAVEADAEMGEVKTGDMRWRPGFALGGWKQKERTVKLKAELVRNIAQDAYDWYRQQKVLSKPGPNGQRAEPADIETFIRSRLMPENHEDARAWTEADIEARIQIGKDEREQMRLLILEQFSASQMTPAATP